MIDVVVVLDSNGRLYRNSPGNLYRYPKMSAVRRLTIALALGTTAHVVEGGVRPSQSPWVRALNDSLRHAIVGVSTWAAVQALSKWASPHPVRDLFLAAVMSSAVDLDHFIAAGSLSLAKATHLQKRPFGHSVLVLGLPWLLHSVAPRPSIILGVAIAAHLSRDGLHKGLWLASDLTTPRLPRMVYLLILVAISFIAARLLDRHPPRDDDDDDDGKPFIHSV